MHEQLDNELKQRIAAVFENFEDPGANDGWLLLREKFPVQNRRGLIWLWLGTAAVVLLFLSIGLWLYNERSAHPTITIEKSKTNSRENSISKQTTEPIKSNKGLIEKQKANSGATDNNASDINKKTDSLATEQVFAANSSSIKTANERQKVPRSVALLKFKNDALNGIIAHDKLRQKALKNNNAAHTQALAVEKVDSLQGNSNTSANNKQTLANALPRSPRHKYKKNYTDLTSVATENDLSEEPSSDKTRAAQTKLLDNDESLTVAYQKFTINLSLKPTAINLPFNKVENSGNAIYAMFAADKRKPDDENKAKSKKVQFGVYEATYLNYAKGSDNQVNLGVGVSSDIYLNDNLKLITGLSVGRNSFSYSGSAGFNSTQNNYAAATVYNLASAYGDSHFTPATSFKNYNAGLVALDIPINIKYEFNGQQDSFYVLTGFSSGTFVSESYTYQYNYQASSAPFNQQILGTTANKSFGSFYFAKTINIAFGAGVPFGKNRLIFEPFLKYPIGGLGAQDISFGSTGLNLKFKFK